MNCLWLDLLHHLSQHAEAYGVGAVALLIAAGKCMPRPGSSLSWLTAYTWVYDTVQSVLPTPRSATLIPTPPVEPAPKSK